MADTDFEIGQSDATQDVAAGFSPASAPGQPAAQCPLAAAAGKGTAESGAQDGAEEAAPKLQAKASVSTDDDPEVGAEYTWLDTEGAAKKWGDDKNNFQLGTYGASLTSGISKVDGGVKADLISGSAEVAGAKAQGQKDLFGGAADVKGSVEALSAQASASVGGELSQTKKAIEAKAGAEASLAKAEAGGEIRIPFPFNKELVLGGNVEGQIGASASASAGGGWSKEDGYFLEAKAKAALGIGAGAGFSIGLRNKNNDG
jgi:hypothetical protein